MFFFLLHRRVNKGTGHYLPPKGDEDDLWMESFHFLDDRSYRGGGDN